MGKKYFITGIDTDAGKSIVTGVLAKYLHDKGVNVITQKMAQTGCVDSSEDIETHRRLMNVDMFPEDHSGETCPYIFPFPAAPQLSAKLIGAEIKFEKIAAATEVLAERYETVLVEGVGGLMVPIVNDQLVIDYMERYPMPTILVANAKLGSVNHTLLSLELCRNRGVNVICVIYNDFIETDPIITNDTFEFLKKALAKYYPQAKFGRFGKWDENSVLSDLPSHLTDVFL